MASLIEIEQLGKVYESRGRESIRALERVDLAIEANEFVTIVGPSGCGKSTLLKMVGGLIPPTSGTIRLAGRQVRAPSRDVGIVFQSAVLMRWRTVLDNVLLAVEILGLDRQAYRERACELLALVGLAGFEQRMPRELSGGMQQRAAICRALVYNPSVLLMDEPFGALDALTREELGLELLRIWDEHQKTVLFVTHSIPEAVLLADRVVVMTPRPGRVADVIRVELPRPRTVDMEFTPEFKAYSDAIRAHIYAGRGAQVVSA